MTDHTEAPAGPVADLNAATVAASRKNLKARGAAMAKRTPAFDQEDFAVFIANPIIAGKKPTERETP